MLALTVIFNPIPLKAASIIVSTKTTVATKVDRDRCGLTAWPDGTMGVLKSVDQYTYFASNGTRVSKVIGTREDPLPNQSSPGNCANLVQPQLSINNLKNSYNFVSGGPVYKDPNSNLLLMFYHAEYWYNNDPKKYYSQLGMAKSTDNGSTWYDVGEIISPDISKDDFSL